MLSRVQAELSKRLQDDCDVLISMLIARENEVSTTSGRSVERLVRLLRESRSLFDVADGWPPFEEVVNVIGLEQSIVVEFATELDCLCVLVGASSIMENPRSREQAAPFRTAKEVITSLQNGRAETSLWLLRQWLEKRVKQTHNYSASSAIEAVARKTPYGSMLPPLQIFSDGPSFGHRSVGNSHAYFVESTLLERSNQAHETVVQAVRSFLIVRGIECFQSSLIDLAYVLNGTSNIVGVKSISTANELEQVRAGYAQLHDYRFRHRDHHVFAGRAIGLWIILSREPAEIWTANFLGATGIGLLWLGKDGELAGPGLHSFERREIILKSRDTKIAV